MFVGDTEDFHWLVHIRLNALKLQFYGGFNVKFYRILRMYKTKLTEQLYWSIIQHLSISKIVLRIVSHFKTDNRMLCCIYLQSIAITEILIF